MTEEWTIWEPIPGLEGKYYIDSFSNGTNGFEILLSKSDNKKYLVKITFEKWIDACSYADESYRVKLVHELSKKYGDNFYGTWTFFKVTNSSYLECIGEQSFNVWDDIGLIHFSLIGYDSVLDIICSYEPKIEIISKK